MISGARRVGGWCGGAVAGVLAAGVGSAAMGEWDCNNNGIPDRVEIAAGLLEDCNGNGIPDLCEYATKEFHAATTPFKNSWPLVVAFPGAPQAISDVRLELAARAELAAPDQFVTIRLGGVVVATVWEEDGEDCPHEPSVATVIVPAAVFNAAAATGSVIVSVSADGPSLSCNGHVTSLALTLRYLWDAPLPDCLGNGRWDGCDIADDPSLDCDGNGLVDLCEIAADAMLDCDGDGVLDACQIAADPTLDCTGNGILNSCEIALGKGLFDYDCNRNGVHDACEIAADPSLDQNGDGILDACQRARGDLDLDRVVDGADLAMLLEMWGVRNPPVGDLDGDGIVGGADLAILLANWGPYEGPWGAVLERMPDPAVVTDPAFRAAIAATGLPWRVRDFASGIELLLVPPGEFKMGCSPWTGGWGGCAADEHPVHAVLLTRPFYLGRYETTQLQYAAVMGGNPSYFRDSPDVPNRPVESVSWLAVQEFNAATGLRLPTEAEWEYACRAGTTTAFNNGSNAIWTLSSLAWWENNNYPYGAIYGTKSVGLKLPNALGFHDMHGNVEEWVADWYSATYYAESPGIDPPGPLIGSMRIARGGNWAMGHCHSSLRSPFVPDEISIQIGFRAARSP